MSLDDPELIAEFVTESREHLADVEGQLLDIEARGDDLNIDLVNKVFRAIHSIKGAAGFLGLVRVNELAHALENVLGKMRSGDLLPSASIIDTMLRASDALSGMINDIDNSNEVDVSEHVERLSQIFDGTSDAESRQASVAVSEPISLHETGEVPCRPAENSGSSRSGGNGPETSIRVPVGVLDRLMNLAGELVLGRNQLLQTVNNSDTTSIQGVAARMDQVTSELQEAIMQTRMQPIGNVFNRFPRVVRDLSAKLGKQCTVVMEGSEVEVDKTIIEAIGDPLTHMVRNSVDHGIETPEKRQAAGKAATGTIRLKAYHQAGKVRIDIIDDGGGIDTERLKQKAIAKGIITPERAVQMPPRDAVWLIFHPGFSTAEAISDISGRGVGMDVVRTNIERIGGAVDIESKLGSGTSIHITLPLTLAIIPSLLVHCRQQRFAVPQANVVELVRVRANELDQRIAHVKGAQVLRLRGNLLPLVPLAEVLGFTTADGSSPHQAQHIVVVESGPFRYGLVVDEIDDSEEIVVKPLGRHLKECTCLAGATILGDGHVAPILDVAGIAARCGLRNHEAIAVEGQHTGERTEDRQSLLLFTNTPSEQFAVPMSLISRIERIRSEQVDSIGGQKLLQYRGYSLPLLALEEHLTIEPRDRSEHVHVIVFQVHGREAGLIAPQLNDICEVSGAIDGETFRAPGVAGSMVIDGRTTRLIDLYELARLAHPKWFEDKPKVIADGDHPPTILLAEDSTFFRKQAREYLEGEGLSILECEDGQEAWETLAEKSEAIDLVITDIEMPRLNGFELTRRIKADPAFSHLPIIALTSLASDEDCRRGMEAGIDDYQIKIDREKVMDAIWRLLKKPQGKKPAPEAAAHLMKECLS